MSTVTRTVAGLARALAGVVLLRRVARTAARRRARRASTTSTAGWFDDVEPDDLAG